MRIAFLTTMATAPWGGSEALWASTALRALDKGHEVFASVYEWPTIPGPVTELKNRGAQVDFRKVGRRWRRSGILTRLFYPFRALHEFRPDVVLINQGGTYDISRSGEFTRLRRVLVEQKRWPYALLCHCEQSAPRHPRTVRRAQQAFKAAQIVGMLSTNLRARSEQHLGIALPNTRLFQNPLNISTAGLLPWPQGTTLRFAFVGRMDRVKGLDLAFEVLTKHAWRERDWILDVYGDGELKAELMQQAQTAGLAQRIRFQGFENDIDSVWRNHHALLLPSRAEGVPNSMLEAMLRGRPVIVSNVGGISEWMRDGQTGYLLSQPHANELAATMERVWNERTYLERIGRGAYEHTLAKRDPDPTLTLLQWLEEIASASAVNARTALSAQIVSY
ncbi:MAG: glycosyltransferase family 4 protein [Povalibacter sp.]